jgi:hypothetical protein
MNTPQLSLIASLLLVCPTSKPGASVTAAHVAHPFVPLRFPDEKQEPAHPPHGEGSGDLLIFTGVSASGAISNVQATAVSFTPEPPVGGRSGFHFVRRPLPPVILRVTSVTRPPRPLLPRARRSC